MFEISFELKKKINDIKKFEKKYTSVLTLTERTSSGPSDPEFTKNQF